MSYPNASPHFLALIQTTLRDPDVDLTLDALKKACGITAESPHEDACAFSQALMHLIQLKVVRAETWWSLPRTRKPGEGARTARYSLAPRMD